MSTRTSIWTPSRLKRPVERTLLKNEKAARLWRSFFQHRDSGFLGVDVLRRSGWFVLLVCVAGLMPASRIAMAQVSTEALGANPVAEVRNNRSWEYGPFVNWGTGVGD